MKTTYTPLIETAESILKVLQTHAGEWVTDGTLAHELGMRRGAYYEKAALEHLALKRQIFMRAISTPSDFYYEYKLR